MMNDDLDFFPNEPFVEVEEKICSIKSKNKKVENLQVSFKFRKDVPGNIEGYILGNTGKSMELNKLRDDYYLNQNDKLIIESTSDNKISSFFSNDFHISNTVIKYSYSPSYSYFIAKLDFKSLEKTINHNREDVLFPTIKYYIPFYNELWRNLIIYKEQSDDMLSANEKEDLFINFEDFKIRIMKEIVYSKNTNENSDIQKHIYCFEFSSRDNSNYPTYEFIEKANKTVRKFILLTSFLSGEEYDWFYSYELSPEKYKHIFKSFDNTNIKRISHSQLLINPNDFLKFIEKAILNYNEALNHNIDLYTSLIYYLTHDKPVFIEQKFIVLYIALENVCYLLSKNMGIINNVNSNLFGKLSESVNEVISGLVKNDESKHNVIKKISELQRSPVKYRFEKIFDKYSIDISDCYKDDQKEIIKFLSIRNKLMHTNYTGDYATIEEYYRIRKYYELLLLKLLGWEKGVSNSYYLYNTYNLKK